jgi:uncharacterized membrane protein
MHPLLAIVATILISSIPGLELRAGIPVGVAMGLSTPTAIAVGTLGNALQIPVALVVVAWAYRHMHRFPRVHKWVTQTEAKIDRHKKLIARWGWLGLAFFVVLPLPGTGVWGGVVLARLLHMARLPIYLGLVLGLSISAIVFGLGTHGAFSVVRAIW